MSDKELNKPMSHEQLNTPRELTAKELDMVFGGAAYLKYDQIPPPSNGEAYGEARKDLVGREQSAPSVSQIIL
jgi:hypothetical protein